MYLTESEKQQVESAVSTFVESANVQAAVTNFLANAQGETVKAIDAVIANAKAGGLAGALLNAIKGSAETEVNALIASLPPAALTALATKAFEGELKSILGG